MATDSARPFATVEELPDSVVQTRAAILAAASARDYDALEPEVDAQVFLSDAGSWSRPRATLARPGDGSAQGDGACC